MKNASGVRVIERDDATVMPELAEELRVALTEIAGVAREGLLAMSVVVGLRGSSGCAQPGHSTPVRTREAA